ncbi:MAG: hypothetical protein AAB858_03315, partial [Patescibacteria group bacterium]
LESSGEAAEKSQKSPIQWMEKAKDFISNPIESLGLNNENNEVDGNNDFENINLTEFVAKSSFTQMKNLDQSGKEPFENMDPNDPQNKAFIEKAIAGIGDPSSFFNPTVDEKDLKISQDNSREAKTQYLKKLEQISNSRLLSNPTYFRTQDQFMKDVRIDCMTGGLSIHKELAQLQRDLLNDYLNLSVPQDWLSLHKDLINYYQKNNLIYSALANCFQDPIKGNLAIQAFPQLVEEGGRIKDALDVKWLEMGL